MNSIVPARIAIACILLLLLACGRRGDGSETIRGASDETDRGDAVVSQTEQDRRIDYVEFLTTNIIETKTFYSEVFGWQFTDYGPDYTSFNDGRLSGGFSAASEVVAGSPLVVIYAANLEDVEAKIKQNGGRIVRETFEFPGGRRFHFSDPGGNELAVWSDR